MPTDETLFDHYRALRAPDGAGEWNLSPECLFTEFCTRDAFKAYLQPFADIRVLNAGIGTGDWDDFLGYWAHPIGTVTSIDIVPEICGLFQYRQSREGHPNPSTVICQDITKAELPEKSFDIVTMIGSTLDETGRCEPALEGCFNVLKPNGRLFLMLFDRNETPQKTLAFLATQSVSIFFRRQYSHYPKMPFHIFIGIRAA
jgi:ubiquinone/menaquinone biosynthesis C-methylase UbiE